MSKDWISPWWQAALLPRTWDVCGVSLPSMSIWHTFALENLGNSYLCGGARSKDAAAGIIIVCSRSRQDYRELIFSKSAMRRATKQAFRALATAKLEDVDAACQEYVTTCTRCVSRWHKGQSVHHSITVPYQWHLVRMLSGCDLTKIEAAWDYNYAEARCLWDANSEHNGDQSIMSYAAQELEDNWDKKKAMSSWA